MDSSAVIARHEAGGTRFEAAGVPGFALDQGDGVPVLCLHGVPVSSFVYRRVVPALVAQGLRGVAVDLPGLGLSGRPADFDYTFTGLGHWLTAAVDALGLDRFHLVVHDIGGPVGFELAAAMPERVRSLTVLNTVVAVEGFTKPWAMRPFGVGRLGEAWLAGMNPLVFRLLMRRMGIADATSVPDEEIDAHLALLRRGDGGRAFLRIMRGFETTAAKQELYAGVLGHPRPVQVVWGERDPALRIDVQGEAARRAAGVPEIHRLPGKHFLQEDQFEAIADLVADLVRTSG